RAPEPEPASRVMIVGDVVIAVGPPPAQAAAAKPEVRAIESPALEHAAPALPAPAPKPVPAAPRHPAVPPVPTAPTAWKFAGHPPHRTGPRSTPDHIASRRRRRGRRARWAFAGAVAGAIALVFAVHRLPWIAVWSAETLGFYAEESARRVAAWE